MFKSLTLIIAFSFTSLYSNINVNNPIDSDKVVRNMGFFGPYNGDVNSDSLSQLFSELDFNKQSNFTHSNESQDVKNFTAMGSNGMHYLWQAYKGTTGAKNNRICKYF
jgi:hypothetical protein